MHCTLEVVLPPVLHLELALNQILKPFDENGSDDDNESASKHAFFDYFLVGGRFSGRKEKSKLDQKRLDAFQDEIVKRGFTVSPVVAGKQKLVPESQETAVDLLWREHFPESTMLRCPLFAHSPQSVGSDICTVADLPADLTASRVIIAAPGWRNDGTLEAVFMIEDSIWNGFNHVDVTWDGKVKSAIDMFIGTGNRYTDEYKGRSFPQSEWNVVTVDYHS